MRASFGSASPSAHGELEPTSAALWRSHRKISWPVRCCSFSPWPALATLGVVQRSRPDRRAARQLIAACHRNELRTLLGRVRAGFAQLDAGEIDEFEMDDVIHHYKRSAAELWKFCGSSGGQWQRAAHTLTYLREHGEEPDWWEAGAPRRRSS